MKGCILCVGIFSKLVLNAETRCRVEFLMLGLGLGAGII